MPASVLVSSSGVSRPDRKNEVRGLRLRGAAVIAHGAIQTEKPGFPCFGRMQSFVPVSAIAGDHVAMAPKDVIDFLRVLVAVAVIRPAGVELHDEQAYHFRSRRELVPLTLGSAHQELEMRRLFLWWTVRPQESLVHRSALPLDLRHPLSASRSERHSTDINIPARSPCPG